MTRTVIVVKYALNIGAACSISLPSKGLAVVAVPTEVGMRLVCNNYQTAYMLSEDFSLQIEEPGDECSRYYLDIEFTKDTDKGRAPLLSLLKSCRYKVEEQGGVPWHVLGIR